MAKFPRTPAIVLASLILASCTNGTTNNSNFNAPPGPTITSANISIDDSDASGGGILVPGDEVVFRWDSSAAGDNTQ